MISDQVWLALIVAVPALITGTIAPLIVVALNNRNARTVKAEEAATRRAEKIEDYARQDAVALKVTEAARQAAEAARLLASEQRSLAAKTDEAAKLLVVSNQRVEDKTAEIAAVTLAKLHDIENKSDVIHTLVNSNMTAAMQSEHDAITRELAQMSEIVALKRAAGAETNGETVRVISATKEKLVALRAALDDRQKQAKVAEQQLAKQSV